MEKEKIKDLRKSLGLTQQKLAELLGVSFATLNRWENGQVRPSQLALEKLRRLQAGRYELTPAKKLTVINPDTSTLQPEANIKLDFLGDPNQLRVLVEGERLSYGHLFNPAFAAEISQIDPLPHQRIAVYEHML